MSLFIFVNKQKIMVQVVVVLLLLHSTAVFTACRIRPEEEEEEGGLGRRIRRQTAIAKGPYSNSWNLQFVIKK